MIVDKKIMKEFKKLQDHGDIQAITEFAKDRGHSFSIMKVSRAMKTGRMKEEVLDVFTEFYSQKKTRVNEKTAELTDDNN